MVANLAVEGPPLLLVSGTQQRGRPTILFYAHYDGQAVNPSRWSRCKPFEPGDVGEWARTVIPNRAEAALDIRLVKGCSGDGMADQIGTHLRSLGYTVVAEEPDLNLRRTHNKLVRLSRRPGGYDAVRTAMGWALAGDVVQAVARGAPPVRIPTMGGSLPFHLFERTLGTPLLRVPLVNHDNNQHGPDENVRVGHLGRGFDVLAAILLTQRT